MRNRGQDEEQQNEHECADSQTAEDHDDRQPMRVERPTDQSVSELAQQGEQAHQEH